MSVELDQLMDSGFRPTLWPSMDLIDHKIMIANAVADLQSGTDGSDRVQELEDTVTKLEDEIVNLRKGVVPKKKRVPRGKRISKNGTTLTVCDGTEYRVVRPSDVGDKPRWWIYRDVIPEEVGELHDLPLRNEHDDIVFALVLA